MRAFLFLLALIIMSCAYAIAADNSGCLRCHSASASSRKMDWRGTSVYLDARAYQRSIHGDLKCTDCHRNLIGQDYPHKGEMERVVCSRCHHMGNKIGAPNFSPEAEYLDSVHGIAVARGDKDAPRCVDCHGAHDILPASDPSSQVYRANIPRTCARCHSDKQIVRRHDIPKAEPLKEYELSVHGRAVEQEGLLAAAVCTDCHGTHDIKRPADPMSAVNKTHIPATCGKCHSKILERYEIGIHGQAIKRGILDAPVCTDCHGEHGIRMPTEKESSVNPAHVRTTCSKCHEDASLQKKYHLPAGRLKTYYGSYHGIANRFGEVTVANCATCHGAHDILPSKDPRSSVNKKNLPRTCGKCHEGAGINFARGSVHIMPTRESAAGVFWVRRFYTVFIIGLIGTLSLYICIDLWHRMRRWRCRGSGESQE